MARVDASHLEILTVAAPVTDVYAFFADPLAQREAMIGVDSCDVLPDGTVRWVMTEREDKGLRFQPDYTLTYEGDGETHLSWRTVAGNLDNDGEVTLEALGPTTTRIRYREHVAPDLPITPLTALLLKPLIARELRSDIAAFVERVRSRFGVQELS